MLQNCSNNLDNDSMKMGEACDEATAQEVHKARSTFDGDSESTHLSSSCHTASRHCPRLIMTQLQTFATLVIADEWRLLWERLPTCQPMDAEASPRA
mmetsp:Transcript_40413/g.65707  ORF Transcript_40413/g.65707 Transcript_40413/m.65707 type:complete len:97 (+) Transcript_40413:159-449(+)